MNAVLQGSPQTGLALAKLRSVPPAVSEGLAVARDALSHTRCGTRAGGLALAREIASDDPSARDSLLAMAQAGMNDPCWQAKTAALRLWYAVAGNAAPLPEGVDVLLPLMVRQASTARPR